jgi:hypothetical protein
LRRTTASRLRDALREIEGLRQHYGVETFRGRRIIPREKWMGIRGETCMGYMPDRCVPWVEYTVQRFKGWLEWVDDYRDLMLERDAKTFDEWSRGDVAWPWIDLLLENGCDYAMARAEIRARGQRRECVVCQFPDIVHVYRREIDSVTEEKCLVCFCKDHVHRNIPESEWDLGGRKFKEREYRPRNRLCKECASPSIVVVQDYETEGFREYYCPDTVFGRAVVSDPLYREKVRRGEMTWLSLPPEALR